MGRHLRAGQGLRPPLPQLVAPLLRDQEGHVAADDFDATLREGARKARRVLQLLERTSAPGDHPRLLAFPEGEYLKVVLSRVG